MKFEFIQGGPKVIEPNCIVKFIKTLNEQLKVKMQKLFKGVPFGCNTVRKTSTPRVNRISNKLLWDAVVLRTYSASQSI